MSSSRSTFTLVLALVGGGAVRVAHAQPHPAFTPMAFLAGSCWLGTFPDGKQTDEHCFEWLYDGKFLRDRHVVRGGDPYQGESTYLVDPTTSTLTYTYLASSGLVVTGTVQSHGDSLVFPSRYATPSGDVELRAIWIRSGTGSYMVRSLQRSGDGWKELWSMVMRRTPR